MGFTSGLMGFERVIFMCFFVAFLGDLQWDFGTVLMDSEIWVGYFWSERGLRVRETRENREFGQSCPLNQTEFNELGFCSCKPSSLNSIYMHEN